MAKEQLMGALGIRSQNQDPAADMALVEIMDKPGDVNTTLKKIFTPQEPEMTPEEAAMAQGGMAGMLPGGGPGEPQGQAPPIQTVLSAIEAEGGGSQTVARMP